jgi:hypothetical protein
MWRSAPGETSCSLEFDLGSVQSLGCVCIWNYNDAWHTDQGVRKMDLSVWTEESGWKKIQEDLAIGQAQGSEDYDEPTVVKLDGVKAQKIRLDDLSNFGDADGVGLSKVQFFATLGPQAAKPSPVDGAKGVHVGGLELNWTAGDEARTHKLYLGVSPDDLKPLGSVAQPVAKISQLNSDTKYYWRIDEVRADASVAAGKVWSFTTGGLEGWWKLDEDEGTKVTDSSGNGHDGMIYGGGTWRPEGGHTGGALEFDGADDYVETGWTPNLPIWTVAAWVKSPAAPVYPTASGPVHCEENFQINWNHGDDAWLGAAGLRVAGKWYSARFGELKADTWTHLAATYDGETLRAYKDGVISSENGDPSGDADLGASTLVFGRHATAKDAFFTGAVDDVCLFAYPLDAESIKALHSGKEPTAISAPRAADSAPRLLQSIPAEATAPSPEDGAERIKPSRLILNWTTGAGATAHNVYLGTDPQSLQWLGKISDVQARLSRLADGTRYYWRVDEVQADGSVVKGSVWSFATANGLLGWWKLDESDGQTVADSSPCGNDGTIVGDAKWQPAAGRFGGALEFDGVGSYVRIENESAFDLVDEVTVAAWVKVRVFDKEWQTIIAKGDNTWRLAREHFAGSAQFTAGWVEEDRIVRGSVDINDGNWHHVVGVGDADSVSLYVDGVLDSVVKTPGAMRPNNEPVSIGENLQSVARGRYWNGWIDEVCVFNYALDANDVKALYSSTEPIARGTAAAPRLLQATLSGPTRPAVAAATETGAQVQPVSAQSAATESASRGGKSGMMAVTLIAVVGVTAGVAFVAKQKSQQ